MSSYCPENLLRMRHSAGVPASAFRRPSASWSEAPGCNRTTSDSHDEIADIEQAEWQDSRENLMREALQSLDDRARDILQRRWLTEGEKTGLQELADEYGVSAERIRQIEAAAMKKLRKAIEVEA